MVRSEGVVPNSRSREYTLLVIFLKVDLTNVKFYDGIQASITHAVNAANYYVRGFLWFSRQGR